MAINDDVEARRLAVRLWYFVDYIFWLPLGTNEDARAALHRLRHHRLQLLHDARGEDGSLSNRTIAGLAWRDIKKFVIRDVRKLMRKEGVESSWVYQISDAPMLFLILPLLFVLAGGSLARWPGVVVASVVVLLIWRSLAVRVGRDVSFQATAIGRNASAWTLPNVLTISRLLAVAAFPVLLATDHHTRAMFVLAAIAWTDWADGFVARHYGLETELGAVLDPVADRVVVGVVVVSMVAYDFLSTVLAAAILLRELMLIVLSGGVYRSRIPVHWAGKVGFTFYMIGLVWRLSAPPLPLGWVGPSATALIVIGLAFAYRALFEYAAQAAGFIEQRRQR